MLAVALAAVSIFPRLIGGFTILRQSDRLHLVMGFAGGAMIGVALFETIPEAFESAGSSAWPAAVVVLGAVIFAFLERGMFHHVHTEDAVCNPRAGQIGAAGISAHAFLDGLAMGAAFQASTELGLLVSLAVLLHAFADGLNTVTVLLRHGNDRRIAITWLLVDALVPVLGAALGLLVPLPDPAVAALLALFAGMFLYLGAGSLLPQAHRAGRSRAIVVAATAAGLAVTFIAASFG